MEETYKNNEKTTTGEDLLTKKEVAEKLRKTVRTVDNWMRDGILPYYKINRAVFFKWSEIETQLAAIFRVHGQRR